MSSPRASCSLPSMFSDDLVLKAKACDIRNIPGFRRNLDIHVFRKRRQSLGFVGYCKCFLLNFTACPACTLAALTLNFPCGSYWGLQVSSPNQMTQEGIGGSLFLFLTVLHMPTPRKSAPFGLEVTRGRAQPSRQPAVYVEVIHKIAELEQ